MNEFTPAELKWWTFKFILKHPIWTIKETIGCWWNSLEEGW